MRINQAQFLGLRSLAGTATSTAHVNVGAVLEINVTHADAVNDTDGDLILSVDGGTTDYMIIRAGEIRPVSPGQEGLAIPGGSQLTVKESGTAPTSGTFYIEARGVKSPF